MRVAHFATDFSPQSETFIYDYVRGQDENGLEVSVLTLNRVNTTERPFPDVHVVDRPSRWDPERLIHRTASWLRNDPPRTASWPQVRRRLETRFREKRPDVVHAHFGPAGVLLAPVVNSLDIPFVVTFYGYDASSLPRKEFWQSAYRSLWPLADAITVLSEKMKETIAGLGAPRRKLSVIHLSRKLEHFSFCPPQDAIEEVLFVGRLTSKKAPVDAIRAIERANEREPSLKLHMVGDGTLREEAERYVQVNGLGQYVTFHGRVPNPEVGRWMKRSDAFLLPSKTAQDGDKEGTPTVLIEAQASGLPCVTTRHAGIPEMIPKENRDMLVKEGDVVALSKVLHELASTPVHKLRRRAERGRKKIEEEFSLESEVGKLESLYRSLDPMKEGFE